MKKVKASISNESTENQSLLITKQSPLRASTAGMVNVPNAKYLAHLPHQTPKTPIYQMC